MNSQELRIKFGSGISNLYDIGYLTTDIQQLVAFADLLEQGDISAVEKYFGERIRGLNRYAKVLEETGRKSLVTDARPGSLELDVGPLALAASIIIPIAIAKVEHLLRQENLATTFEINPADEKIRKHIAAYSEGKYGRGQKALNNLFEALSRNEYNITVIAEHVYRIEHVTDKYAARMAKTIKRNVGSN